MSSKFLKSIKPLPVAAEEEFVEVDKELLPENDTNYGNSDDEQNHSKLLNDISSMDAKTQKQLKWKATRFESKKVVNEFNISKSKSSSKISIFI